MALVLTLTSDRLIYKLHPELVLRWSNCYFQRRNQLLQLLVAQGMAAEITFDGIPRDVHLNQWNYF